MKEELGTAKVTEFLSDLKELLSQKPENVRLTNRQLADFPERFEMATRKCEEVIALRRKQDAERKAKEDEKKKAEEKAEAEERARIQAEERIMALARERAIADAQKRERDAQARAKEEKQKKSAQSQVEEERFLLDSGPHSPFSNASRGDPIEDFGKMQIGNNERPAQNLNDSIQPIVSNVPCVDFSTFIQADGAYLMLKKQEWPEKLNHDLKNEIVQYPLGVAYDEALKLWLVCDRNTDKIVLLNVRLESIRVCEDIKGPTAIIVYEEGKSVAILCADGRFHTIYIYNHADAEPFIEAFATHDEPMYDMKCQLRGLAKSLGGNIISLEKSKLHVFNKNIGGKGFVMKGAVNPCFIATYRSTVAVSDLAVNKVFIFNLDDKNWDSISFNRMRVIETTVSSDVSLSQLANVSGFRFVAGMQFDVNGYLLIGDARGHSIKLYDTEYNFLHRVSSDFLLPYVSSFYVNKDGECVLLDVRNRKGPLLWVKMTSIPQILKWVSPADGEEEKLRRADQQKPRRGGFQQKKTF